MERFHAGMPARLATCIRKTFLLQTIGVHGFCVAQGFGAYSDYYVSPKCVEFTQERAKSLVENNLRQCLVFHLFHLWDLGLVDKECVDECVELYDICEAENCGSGSAAAAAEGSAASALALGSARQKGMDAAALESK